MQIGERFTRLKKLDNKLGILLDVQKLGGSSSATLNEKCGNLAVFYNGVINGYDFYVEVENWKMLFSTRQNIKVVSQGWHQRGGQKGLHPASGNLSPLVREKLTICWGTKGKKKSAQCCIFRTRSQLGLKIIQTLENFPSSEIFT